MCSILTKTVRLSATFLSYRTHQYEHLEEEIMSLAPLFTEIQDIEH